MEGSNVIFISLIDTAENEYFCLKYKFDRLLKQGFFKHSYFERDLKFLLTLVIERKNDKFSNIFFDNMKGIFFLKLFD